MQRGRRYFAVAPLAASFAMKRGNSTRSWPGLARRVAAEAREAVGDVGRVADLAGLAVADDVDAGLDLAADDVGDGVR